MRILSACFLAVAVAITSLSSAQAAEPPRKLRLVTIKKPNLTIEPSVYQLGIFQDEEGCTWMMGITSRGPMDLPVRYTPRGACWLPHTNIDFVKIGLPYYIDIGRFEKLWIQVAKVKATGCLYRFRLDQDGNNVLSSPEPVDPKCAPPAMERPHF